MPFMVAGDPAHNLRLCAMLLLVNGLYALRARTEARHLLQDPAYQAYAHALGARQQALQQRLWQWLRRCRRRCLRQQWRPGRPLPRPQGTGAHVHPG